MKTARKSLLLLITVFVLFMAACDRERDLTPTPAGTYSVDPIFQEFYKQLGGNLGLGPAISPLLSENGNFYQYTTAALLEYDPQAPENSRVRLFPLGLELGIHDYPKARPSDGLGTYVDGYLIFEKFVPLYERLGGVSLTGKPLSEVHWNTGKNRYEQYFENLGMYWIEGDDEDAVYLLPIGDWKCARQCDYQPPSNAIIEIPSSFVTPIRNKAVSLGLAFTGLPLAAPSLASDGRVEQIYENVILATDVQVPEDVRLLPLPEVVGIQREAPNISSPSPRMVFVPTDSELGYNVPLQFDRYISENGGYGFIGLPITHVSRIDSTHIEQCFLNLCLQGELLVNGTMDVSPKPLGYGSGYDIDEITIRTWERYPLVAPQEEQELGVIVLSGGKPARGVAIELGVQQPDGYEQIYQLPPTDEKGETMLKLDPIDAENSTLVPYKACARMQNQQRFCVLDSFVIWDLGTTELTPTLPPLKTSYLPFVMRNLHLYVPAFFNRYLTYMPFVGNER